jgi:hypothetical protein
VGDLLEKYRLVHIGNGHGPKISKEIGGRYASINKG